MIGLGGGWTAAAEPTLVEAIGDADGDCEKSLSIGMMGPSAR